MTIGAGAIGAEFWVGMTALFHITFHLQPAIIGILAGLTLRRRAGPGLSPLRTVFVGVASAAGLVGGAAAIAALPGSADPVPFTVVVTAGGAIVGLWLLSRPPSGGRTGTVATDAEGARAERAERG